jgi:hypothetical protein
MMTMQTIKFKDLNEDVKELLNGGFAYSSTFDLGRSAPTNIPYGQKLYMKFGKELVAVKIIMATYIATLKDPDKFNKFDNSKGCWCYLVQTPYGTEWRNDITKVMFFHSKEEYFKHLEMGTGGFSIKYESFASLTNRGYGTLSFRQSWRWNGHCAEPTASLIRHIIINEDGISIILDNQQCRYWSKDACTKANIDGLKIVDFPETEHSIKVSIEVVKNEPIVRTLTFMEQ